VKAAYGELSEADQTIERHGVTILGPTNLPAEVPFHASQMYSSNVVNFLKNMVEDGQRRLNLEDEIVRETLITHGGRLVSPRLAEILHQPKPEPPTPHAEELPPEADKPAAEPASEEPKEEPSAEEKAEPEGSGGAGEPSPAETGPAETGPAETGPAETGEEKPKPESEGPR